MFLGRSLVKEKKPATWNKTETKKKKKQIGRKPKPPFKQNRSLNKKKKKKAAENRQPKKSHSKTKKK
jgi:hypothetical protein